jgi:hypothetical protein
MQTRKIADEKQNTWRRENSKLDDRYGKIGISAVAAAVRCRDDEHKPKRALAIVQDSD